MFVHWFDDVSHGFPLNRVDPWGKWNSSPGHCFYVGICLFGFFVFVGWFCWSLFYIVMDRFVSLFKSNEDFKKNSATATGCAVSLSGGPGPALFQVLA